VSGLLVTGGAGFIGSSVVRELLDRGHEVRVLDDLSTGYASNLEGLDVDFVEGDVRDAAAVDAVMSGRDGVFHLAAQVGNVLSIEKPLRDMAVNAGGTLNVLEAMRAHGVSRIVYSSSAACVGEALELPVTEAAACEPDSPYGISKLAAEKYALAYQRLYDWDVATLRYFNVYGVRQRFDAYGNVIPIFAERIFAEKPLLIFGDGTQTRDFVNVRDIARANVDAFEARARGVFNIATGVETTVIGLAESMNAYAPHASAIEFAPPRKGEVLKSVASVDRARTTFGYSPSVSLEAGLAEYMAWFSADVER